MSFVDLAATSDFYHVHHKPVIVNVVDHAPIPDT